MRRLVQAPQVGHWAKGVKNSGGSRLIRFAGLAEETKLNLLYGLFGVFLTLPLNGCVVLLDAGIISREALLRDGRS